MKILLVDLSNVFWVYWHAGVNQAARWPFDQTMGSIRALSRQYDATGVMADGKGSFRREIEPRWKADRDEKDPGAVAMLKEIESALDGEGFHVFKVEGLESDDLMATAVKQLRFDVKTPAETHLTLHSNDRDLWCLLDQNVEMLTTASPRKVIRGEMLRASEKIGVDPPKIRDWLVLCDDHNGVNYFKGIGPKHAARLLNEYGSLQSVVAHAHDVEPPKVRESILRTLQTNENGQPMIDVAVEVMTLRTDAPIDISVIFGKKEPKPGPVRWDDGPTMEDAQAEQVGPVAAREGTPALVQPVARDAEPRQGSGENAQISSPESTPLAECVAPAETAEAKGRHRPTEERAGGSQLQTGLIVAPRWELALEPVTPRDANKLAETAWRAGFWPRHGGIEGHMIIILAGRCRGLTAFDALNGMHIIEGAPRFGAYLLIGMVQRDKRCLYFELAESDDKHAVWITKRKGGKVEQRRQYTIEQAENAGLLRPTRNGQPSTWSKNPEDMLIKAAGAKLTRAVYADITSGAVAVEELPE